MSKSNKGAPCLAIAPKIDFRSASTFFAPIFVSLTISFPADRMPPTLRYRPLRRGDVGLCTNWLLNDFSAPAPWDGDGAVAEVIDRLIQQERIKGAMFEKFDEAGEAWHTLSIGISGFVHPEIVDAHLARPEPFLMHKVIGLAATKAPHHFMGPDEQAYGNTAPGAGLDLLAHWMQRSWNTDDPLWRQVYMMAHEDFIKEHRGFRINRMFHEDWMRAVDIYLALGHRVHSTFDVNAPAAYARTSHGGSTRALYCMDREEILSYAPGSAASYLLQYVDPICGFTRAQQRLLRRATDGLTDRQLTEELDLSLNTLKSMWRSIFERVESHVPHVLSEADIKGDDAGVRGSEKRRAVLNFVETHPQELRPYRRP